MRCMGCMREYTPDTDTCPHCGYVKDTPVTHSNYLKPGTMVAGRYLIGKALGSGGFGITYIAWDSFNSRAVAIKEYLPGVFAYRVPGQDNVAAYNKESGEKFRAGMQKTVDESNTLARFNSLEGVVDVYNCVEANGTVYIIMEYLEGRTLKEELKEHGSYSFDEALGIMSPILNALYQIHDSKIIHRDISPDNIFICTDGTVRLIDFGAARVTAFNDDRKSLSVILKRGYAPKEQYFTNAAQGPWTDVYACAATLYRMLTGVVPQESLEREVQDALAPPSELGVDLPEYAEHAIMRALVVNPEHRTQNTDDFFRQLTDPECDVPFEPEPEEEPEPAPVPSPATKKSKKPLIVTLVTAALLIAGIVGAVFYVLTKGRVVDNGQCGENLVWSLNSEGVLSISGKGHMDDYGNYVDTPWHSEYSKINIISIDEGVESIGSRAFYGCTALAKAELPSTLKTIGSYAFYGCSKLENCILPSSVTTVGMSAFENCLALEYLHIPSGVSHFGADVIKNCPRAYVCSDSADSPARQNAANWLVDFKVCNSDHSSAAESGGDQAPASESTTLIEDALSQGSCGDTLTWAYTGTGELIIRGSGRMKGWIIDEKTGTWSADNIPEWESIAKDVRVITVEDGVTDIGNSAFAGFTSVQSVSLPESLMAIGSNAFMGCTTLRGINIPVSVSILGDGAFKDCSALINVNLNSAVTQIGQYTFSGCKSLAAIALPVNLTSIGNYAFADCETISQFTLPPTLTSIGDYCFKNCFSLKSLLLPYGVKSIPKGAFAGSGLETFDIPSSVGSVGEGAFSGCSALKSVNIPNSVTVIGQGAFGGCTSLAAVILPSSVSTIGSYAFSSCASLKYVHIPSTVSNIGDDIIENTSAQICCDKTVSKVSSYSLRNSYSFRVCGGRH